MVILAITALVLLVWIVRQDGPLVGAALAFAGLLHLLRLGRWAGDRTFSERLVLILRVGYAFVPLGFLLGAAAALNFVAPSAGIHAWMAGAAGIMTLAVMTRATLGHTGQPLIASPSTQAIYVSAVVAVLARICAVIEPLRSEALLDVAAGLGRCFPRLRRHLRASAARAR